ncbi:methionine ABC transporter permease [Streptobacillus moniliformis]|uniref:Binding-protein-dependent transport systems inner membrane component n=1 Tax=Streptobacillus moniliformis (strain ATCC 14647 / DSM 12112 / NCTC 10651 / 9901) TaxID=519441 RepID=D1AWU3_STRM9|nr:ABC transporter permease subunit [Streptobacillus moniliformis]ACZ00769.1 binding-protein-dependent transport systems inner membrane component [Streptobacillus moniliformis DSM 12112]AVL42837.1 methionine ABC transporter ATP-binding protein [Streptobacillus moniliformis]SQA14101.1 Methionine import system permease protein MetP [Streptobacillus moniliformis]
MDYFTLELLLSIKDTFIMVLIPTICAILFGIPLGALLYITKKGGLKENIYIYLPINIYINVVRSFPFLIFVIVLIPLTRLVFGTAFGLLPASFPICFVAVALYARFVEQSFHDVDLGIIDAALSMKATSFQIVWHFLLVESRSSLVLGLTSSIISFISYSTVMGIVGGGGIGDFAIRYGYQEYNYPLVYKVVSIMIIIVFFIQILGNKISKKLDKRRRDF